MLVLERKETKEEFMREIYDRIYLQKYDEAVCFLNVVVSYYPAFAEAFKELAVCYDKLGIVEEARVNFRKAVDCPSSTSWKLFFQSYLAYSEGDLESGLGLINRAIEIERQSTFLHQRGFFYIALSKTKPEYLESAITDYLEVESDVDYPKRSIIYNNLGILYLERGEHEKSKTCLDKSIQLEPQNIRAHVNRSTYYEDRGDYAQAAKDYQSILELNPEVDYFLHYFKSRCHMEIGEKKQSLYHSRIAAFKTFHKQIIMYYFSGVISMGHAQTSIKDIEELKLLIHTAMKTEVDQEKLLSMQKSFDFLLQLKGELSAVTGNFSEARKAYTELRKTKTLWGNYPLLKFITKKLSIAKIDNNTFHKSFSLMHVELEKLETFCSELKESGFRLNTTKDQQYFLCCYIYKSLELYSHVNEDSSITNFMNLISKRKGFQRACKNPQFLCKSFTSFLTNGILDQDLIQEVKANRKLEEALYDSFLQTVVDNL